MMHAAVYIAVAAVVLVTAKHEHLPNRLARAPCNERERTGVRHVNVPSMMESYIAREYCTPYICVCDA